MPDIFTRAGSCSLGSSQSNAAAAGFRSSCLSAALCKLSAMAVDNEKLISCVGSRTSLWLATHKDHKNRQVKDALWKEVGQIMYPGKASKGTYGAFPPA